MGVKLKELFVPEKITLERLKGRIIAVDAPNIIFGLFNFSYKNQQFSDCNMMTDRTQRPISHLYGLLYRVNFLYSKHIFPVFCFDGRVSELKRLQTKDFLNDFRFAKQWYEKYIQNGNKEMARQIALSKDYLWPNIMLESRQLLNAMGIPYIDSPASAESQCAQLVKDGIAYYSNSQDMDSLLFGCPRVLQNLSKSSRRKVQGKWVWKKVIPEIITLKKVLKTLKIDQFQLVDIGILIGLDYFEGIKGIGAKTALNLMSKYGSLEKIIHKQSDNYDFSKLTPDLISKIRQIFLFPNVLMKFKSIQWEYPNELMIAGLMCNDHSLNKERVSKNIKKLIDNYLKCKSYFELGEINKPLKIQKKLF